MWTGRMRGTTISHARPQLTLDERPTFIFPCQFSLNMLNGQAPITRRETWCVR